MFQFTTTVINSNKDTSGKSLWSRSNGSFYVKRVNEFKIENITAVYKAAAYDAVYEKAEINFETLAAQAKKGDMFRLNMYIGLSEGSNDPLYANDFYFKGRPFVVDFVWDESKGVGALKDMITKFQMNVYGEKFLDITVNGNTLVITAKTEYQRFRKVAIEKLNAEKWHGMGEFEEVTATGLVTLTPGKESFGTYSWILHNLRLPTTAHTDAWSINQKEMPIPGAKYTQYTIHYCVDRGTLGLNAVGHQVTSATTHVFYVLESLASSFETALFGTPTPDVPDETVNGKYPKLLKPLVKTLSVTEEGKAEETVVQEKVDGTEETVEP